MYAVDYRGTSVPQAAELRTKLRDTDTRFRVVKNTLTERAADAGRRRGAEGVPRGPDRARVRPRRRRGGRQGAGDFRRDLRPARRSRAAG